MKWLLFYISLFFLCQMASKGLIIWEIWPKMTENWSKYAKIKVFDTLIKIQSLILTGNDFKWLLLYSASFLIITNAKKSRDLPYIWPNMDKKIGIICKNQDFWHFDQKWLNSLGRKSALIISDSFNNYCKFKSFKSLILHNTVNRTNFSIS